MYLFYVKLQCNNSCNKYFTINKYSFLIFPLLFYFITLILFHCLFNLVIIVVIYTCKINWNEYSTCLWIQIQIFEWNWVCKLMFISWLYVKCSYSYLMLWNDIINKCHVQTYRAGYQQSIYQSSTRVKLRSLCPFYQKVRNFSKFSHGQMHYPHKT